MYMYIYVDVYECEYTTSMYPAYICIYVYVLCVCIVNHGHGYYMAIQHIYG